MLTDKHSKYYITSLFLCELARTFPHAVLSIILINKGIKLEEIAAIQIFYMLAIILFEFPSGVISDLFNRKTVYICSVLVSIVSYLTIYKFNTFGLLCISWFIYGLSVAISSGTIDVSFTNLYKNDALRLKKFISQAQIAVSIAAIIGGFVGSRFYLYIDDNIYLISIFLYIISFFIVLLFIPSNYNADVQNRKINQYIKKFTNDIVNLLKSKKLMELFILISIVQFFFQPFYQYWQLLFTDRNILPSLFGYLYTVFRLTDIIASKLYEKIKPSYKNSIIILLIIIVLISINYIIFNPYLYLLSMTILLTLVMIYLMNLDFCLRESVDSNIMGTIISLNSTINRLFSIIILAIVSFLVNKTNLNTMFFVTITIFVGISLILNLLYLKRSKSIET